MCLHQPLFVIGIGLYWGEGHKTLGNFALDNSDPAMAALWMKWVKKYLITRRVTVSVYIHNDVDAEVAKAFWSNRLQWNADIAVVRVDPVSSKRKRTSVLPYGTVRIRSSDATEMNIKMSRWLELASMLET